MYPDPVTGVLRSAWSAPRAAPPPPRRVWRDGALIAVVALAAVAESILRTDLAHPLLSVIALLALLPTMLWRRVQPLWMLVIALLPVDLILPTTLLYAGTFVLVMIYALYRWGSGRDLVIGTAVIAATLAITFVRGGSLDEVVGGTALLLATVLLGVVIRSRAGARQRLLDQVREFEREQLARDLHDTVAHHVSAITIRAQAGLAVAQRDARAALDALDVIEGEAGRTLTELRSIVRVLCHDGSAELTPSPHLGYIERLAGVRPGGASVSVAIEGDTRTVPPPVAAAVFRIAQESVTNALRHARDLTRVDVRVDVDDRGLRLRATNDGDIALASTPGFGIIGMTERAALLGGTCSAGPGRDGGWVVSSELPRAGWTP